MHEMRSYLRWVIALWLWLSGWVVLWFSLPERTTLQNYALIQPEERIDFSDYSSLHSWATKYNYDLLDGFIYEYCATADFVLYYCDEYVDHAISMLPKIHRIVARVEERFETSDMSDRYEIKLALYTMLAQEFDEMQTEKNKFTLSLMRKTINKTLFNEDVRWWNQELTMMKIIKQNR